MATSLRGNGLTKAAVSCSQKTRIGVICHLASDCMTCIASHLRNVDYYHRTWVIDVFIFHLYTYI